MSKRPAIAMIIPGGIGTGKDNIGVPVLRGLVKLIAARYDLTIFQLSTTNYGFEADGFELISVYHPNTVIRSVRFPFIFRRYHKKKNFIAVHGFWAMPAGMLAVIVGKLFGIKSVVSLLGGDAAGLPQINYGRLHKPLLRQLVFWTIRNATNANALTQYLANNLKEYGFEGRKIDIIPWGVDRALFDYHPKPIQSSKFKILNFLHIANFHPVKDQETLIKAFDLITKRMSARLVIVGAGGERSKIIALIESLSLSGYVQIIDPVPYEQLEAIYHDADVLLHTSLSEGQSEVVTEAMSCGLVVCGTRVGLVHDLPECCVAVDIGDYTSLAEKTIRLIEDPERMNDMRMCAHGWTLQHDILWTANRLMHLYGS